MLFSKVFLYIKIELLTVQQIKMFVGCVYVWFIFLLFARSKYLARYK